MLGKTSYFDWLKLNSHFFWQAEEQIQYMTKLAAKNIDGQCFAYQNFSDNIYNNSVRIFCPKCIKL